MSCQLDATPCRGVSSPIDCVAIPFAVSLPEPLHCRTASAVRLCAHDKRWIFLIRFWQARRESGLCSQVDVQTCPDLPCHRAEQSRLARDVLHAQENGVAVFAQSTQNYYNTGRPARSRGSLPMVSVLGE